MKRTQTKKIAVSAALTALAFIVTMFTAMFKVGGFLSLDLKDAVLSMITLMYGPFYGIISVVVVALVEFVTISTTDWYGLVMNILSSGTFALVCGLVYRFKRSFSGAIVAAVLTVFSVTGVMLVANIFITPMYFSMPRQAVLDMLPTLILPFNLAKSVLNASIMLLVYKPFTTALKKNRLLETASEQVSFKLNKRSVILTVISVLLIVAALAAMASLGITVIQ